ncbi:DUF6049 family protein [Mariniluteicoccus flavus]
MIRLVRVLLAGLLALLAPTLAVPVAHAADDQQVAITIDQFDPATPDRAATITIRGKVTNTSSEPLSTAQALFWRDWSPITSADGMRAALESPATQPYGGRVTDIGAFQPLTTDQKTTIAPGETVPFQVQAPVSSLELPRTAGVYLMGVHVVGKIGRRASATLGRARVFVPLPRQNNQGAAPTTPATVKVPTVVMLTSRPSMVRPGLFADDHLAEEMSANGRLSKLMRAASRTDVSHAIDPALLQAARAMADDAGYQIRQADGAMVPGTGQAVARRWLADLDRLDETHAFRLPFAVPDLTPIAHQALEDTFHRIVSATTQVDGIRDLPLLGYANGGFLDTPTVGWIERMDPAAILVANARTEQALLAPIQTAPLVAFSGATFAGGPGPDPRQTAIHVRQRLLADTWLAATNASGPQVHVVASADEADADLGARAAWIARVPLTDTLRDRPSEWSEQLDYTPEMRAAELSPAQVGRLRDLSRAQAAYAEMMVDPAPHQRDGDAQAARSASSWWRGNPAGFQTWIDPLLTEANQALTGAVKLTAQKTVIMSGQSGSFPVTVTNTLRTPVRVAIDFDSDQPQRLSIPRHENIEVPAGQSTTVNVRPRAAANGPVMVTAQLVTPGGTPLGRHNRVEVRATNFGFVGWIIVVASGIVLLAATALRIRQVARERVSTNAARRAAEDATVTAQRPAVPVVRIEPTEGSGE